MKQMDRPIPKSYWVVPGRLLAGEYPGQSDDEVTRKRIDALIEAGFDMFVDLTNSNETWPYLNVLLDEAKIYQVEAAHLRFPIGDFGLPTAYQMNSILDSIDQKSGKWAQNLSALLGRHWADRYDGGLLPRQKRENR